MSKRITIKDVAEDTGLSIAAVSYVLNDKDGVRPETRELVLSAVERLGYVPNYTARGLASHKSRLIGVCSPQTEPGSKLMFDNPFYSKLFSSIEYECRQEGYHVIVSGTDADESFLKLAPLPRANRYGFDYSADSGRVPARSVGDFSAHRAPFTLRP